MSPGLVMAVLLILLFAQCSYVLAGRRLRYVLCLVAAAIGVPVGELVAQSGPLSLVHLGALHPLGGVLITAFLMAIVWTLFGSHAHSADPS